MNNIFNIYYSKSDVSINYFFDDKKGIIKNFEKCNNDNGVKLSDVKYLSKIGPNIKELDIELKDEYYEQAFNFFQKSMKQKQFYVCLKHYGSYDTIKNTYDKLLKYIKVNDKEICGLPMEQYINGRWNKNKKADYLTIVMIPIRVNIII